MATFYPQAHAVLSVVFDGFGEDDRDSTPKIIPVRPQSATVVRNTYRQADSWDLTFEAIDFPMDPRMVRTGQVEIWLYAAESKKDQRLVEIQGSLGVPTIPRSLLEASKQGAETIAVNRGEGVRKSRTGVRRPTIAGLFDEHSIEFSNSGKWVTISGQDFTALLIAKQWPPTASGRARKIPVGQRLDRLLTVLLSEADSTGKMELVVEGVDPSDIPRVTGEVNGNRTGIPIEQDTSYWDVMYRTTIRYGLILFVRGVEVVLARPNNIGAHNAHRIRRMAWGRNLEQLEMSRKMGRQSAPSIIMRGYDPKRRKVVFGEFPQGALAKVKEDARTTKVTGGGRTKTGKVRQTNIKHTEEYQIIPAYGISDPKVLNEMAQTRFTLLGNSERIVRFRTRDLRDLGRNGERGQDLMDLSTGDAFFVTIEQWEQDRQALLESDVGLAQRVAILERKGYKPAIARIVADKFSEIEILDRPLKVREVTYDFSASEGISIEAELMDFIIINGVRSQDAKRKRRDQERLAGTTAKPLASRRRKRALGKQFGN